jgi:hypothetical protein
MGGGGAYNRIGAYSFGNARTLEKSMVARNRVGIGLSYRPARPHRLKESIPWNRYLGSLNVYKFGLRKFFKIAEILGLSFSFYGLYKASPSMLYSNVNLCNASI